MQSKISFALAGILVFGIVNPLVAADPARVAQVKAGTCREARVSWWGFDANDSTRFLQAALDSGVPRLIVDKMPSPWIARPLKGASNQTVVFEPGAEIRAKRGEFLGTSDALLTYDQKVNVTLEGAGTLRMWHQDYRKPPYKPAEWRHTLSFLSCSNVVVKGLSLVDSGGDGIYLGARGPIRKNTDVVIRDVVCRDNHRQGISVISAEDLLIEHAQLLSTHGTAPQAGIDFEPNHPQEVLKNCVMRNCRMEGNAGPGYYAYVGQLTASSAPVDLRFENCVAVDNGSASGYWGTRGSEVPAKLTFVNCRFEPAKRGAPVRIRENRFSPMSVTFTNSVIVAKDGKVQPMDAAWVEEYLPRSVDPAGFLPKVKLDFATLTFPTAQPGGMVKLAPLRARHSATYLCFADQARELHFRGRQIRVGRYAFSKQPMRLTDVTGRVLAKIPIPQETNQTFSVLVPARGFYRLEVDAAQCAFLLAGADVPVALDGSTRSVSLVGSEGVLRFCVPAGTDRFDFWAIGEGGERVSVSLRDADGKCVWQRKNLDRAVRSKQIKPLAGYWSVEIARPTTGCFEDSHYDLAGIPAVFFLTPSEEIRRAVVLPAKSSVQ